MKWLVKISRDESGEVTSKDIMYRTDNACRPRGGEYALMDGPDTQYPKISEDGESVEANVSVSDLKDAYKLMDDGIAYEASLKIGTTNRESLLAFVDAYQLRMMVPEQYLDFGLVAEIPIGAFSVGDALDTVDKIKEYYSNILVYLDKDRTVKIKQYLTTKSNLGL